MKLRRVAFPVPASHPIDAYFFFLLFFLYVWLVIDPRLIYHTTSIFLPISFSVGWPFFHETVSQPGGLTAYIARWLTQWYSIGWVGALITTTAAWAACKGIDVLTDAAGRPRSLVVRYVPAVLLLMIWNGYSHPLEPLLSLLSVLACFSVYLFAARLSGPRTLAVHVVVCIILYVVAGAGGLLYVTIVSVYEILLKPRWFVAVTAALIGIAVPWAVSSTLFGGSIRETYENLIAPVPGVPASARTLLLALYLWFPIVLAMAAILARVYAWRANAASPSSDSPAATNTSRPPGRGRRIAAMATVLIFAGVLAWLSLDTNNRILLLGDYYSRQEMWPEVLKTADQAPYGLYNPRCNRNVMLALYHTGRLGDEMFRYPQVPDRSLYSTPEAERDAHSYLQESRLFLELGQVNRAERCAYEAFETAGELPPLLKHLAMIKMVKDQPETARMFLTALSKKLFYRRDARNMLQRLQADSARDDDVRTSELRRVMVRQDTVAPQSVEAILTTLLQEQPRNQMAFEFLIAHCLCSRRPDKAVAYLKQYAGSDDAHLPRHFQEAIIVSSLVTTGQFPSNEKRLDSTILVRAKEFNGILTACGSNKEAARATAVAEGFGKSYFFYFAFSASGL